MDDMKLEGAFMFQALVICVNFKIALSTNTHTWCSLFGQIIGVILFFLVFLLVSLWDFLGSSLNHELHLIITFESSYLITIFLIFGFAIIEWWMNIWDNIIKYIIQY